MTASFQITRLRKSDGPLTKTIRLGPDGSIQSDGSACFMARGNAKRVEIGDACELAELIASLQSDEALALGALRDDLPDDVKIVTKQKMNGASRPDIIARTGDFIVYKPKAAAWALLDYDRKGMPPDVAAQLEAAGGHWAALLGIVPELARASRVTRLSTSAGLMRADTNQVLPGSGGLHDFIAVSDGTDIERFLTVLHSRCWLAGYGWYMVGASGQMLERSIVDRMVGAPERIVFEGAPRLHPPLAQDQNQRRPVATEGGLLDTTTACPPLTIIEEAKLRDMRAAEAQRLAPLSNKASAAFIARRSTELAGVRHDRAAHIIKRQCDGILLPSLPLPFDDPALAGKTVADVLADPASFEGATLADPNEGTDYGTCKAKILLRGDGSAWIRSFAHGKTGYELRYDFDAVKKAIEDAPKDQADDVLVRLAVAADVEPDEIDALKSLACERSGTTKRAINSALKQAQKDHAARQAQEARERQTALRRDPRLRLLAPAFDAERLPMMEAIDEVLAGQPTPMRDTEGRPTEARCRPPDTLHEMIDADANQEADG